MNKDQANGAVKNAEGRVQERLGKLTGSPNQQVRGIFKQISGTLQQSVGNVKEIVSNRLKH